MKKLLFLLTIITITLINTGCATWDGIKQDTSNMYNATKEVFKDATNE